MKVWEAGIALLLILALATSAASFTMPSLLGRPIIPQMTQQPAPQLPSGVTTPEQIKGQAASATFDLSVTGNVYYDKLPVEGATLTVYLNGEYQGTTTAGQIYTFTIPGVRVGDTIRIDADYRGNKGTNSAVVKFKNMNLDVSISSGHSFILNALSLLPTGDELSQAQKQGKAPLPSSITSGASSATSPLTSSAADTAALGSQINAGTAQQLASTMNQAQQELAHPAQASTADAGSSYQITSLPDAMKAAGFDTLPVQA